MQKYLKNQRGSALIMVTLVFVMLCGFAGLAIDVGQIVYHKQKIQNAVDAAAMAAAQEIANGNAAVQQCGKEFALKNGLEMSEFEIHFPYNADTNKIEVVATRNLNLAFLPTLGVSDSTVSARAVGGIRVDTLTLLNDMALQYAVFHGDANINLMLKGNGSSVFGNIHSNDDMEFSGNGHFVDGNLTANEDIRVDAVNYVNDTNWSDFTSKVTLTGKAKSWDQIIPIPTIDFDKYADNADHVVNGDVLYNGDLNIDGIWLINGNCHLAGQRISGNGVLLVTGSLTISGGTQYDSADDLLAIHVGDDVDISAANADIVGAIFAPNGDIRINGSGNTFHGALIANTVTWAAQDITIHGVYDNRVPQAFEVELTIFTLFE